MSNGVEGGPVCKQTLYIYMLYIYIMAKSYFHMIYIESWEWLEKRTNLTLVFHLKLRLDWTLESVEGVRSSWGGEGMKMRFANFLILRNIVRNSIRFVTVFKEIKREIWNAKYFRVFSSLSLHSQKKHVEIVIFQLHTRTAQTLFNVDALSI